LLLQLLLAAHGNGGSGLVGGQAGAPEQAAVGGRHAAKHGIGQDGGG
jgi:hypothetical protein